MIVSGWLVDRFDVNWVLAGGFAIWSLATALTGLVHGFATLMACRLLLGAGESVAFPAYGKILARHIAQGHRGWRTPHRQRDEPWSGPRHSSVGRDGNLRLATVFIVLGLPACFWLVPWIYWMAKAAPTAERFVCPASVGRFFAGGRFGARRSGTFAVTTRFIS